MAFPSVTAEKAGSRLCADLSAAEPLPFRASGWSCRVFGRSCRK